MKQKSAIVLLTVVLILIPIGVMGPGPSGVLLSLILAGIFSSIAAALSAKRVRQSFATVLLVVSVILIPMGLVVISPEAGLFFLFLAGVFSSIAAALGAKGVRYTALVLLLVAASTAVWRYPEAKRFYGSYLQGALESSAIYSVRNLVTSQSTYSDTTGRYAPDLEALSNEGLIDSVLASGTRDGYTFSTSAGSDGRTFTVNARPVTRGERTSRSFYSDHIGVGWIRYTKEDRPATADDPPLGQ